MDYDFIRALDEYFCSRYADYTRICATEGYKMPDLIHIGRDGNVSRLDSAQMRFIHQENCAQLLDTFKDSLADTDFTFHFSFVSIFERVKDRFRKYTFAKLLPKLLGKHDTVQSAGEKLDIDEKFWNGIVKGRLYPEKNTVLALALVCRLSVKEATDLLAVSGFSFDDTCVRDIVVEYLLTQKIYNEEMRDAALREYRIENLPIKRSTEEKDESREAAAE